MSKETKSIESEEVKITENEAIPADSNFMLEKANQYIEKLEINLKEKELEINMHVRKWQFYEQLIRNLTTFKG